ncbi:hypothetical protein ACIPK5_18940 [Streptomyces sp. NPDC086843]|uniref:hypothetical protein n=1 Tax=Streptomyces sp. NPDC086843 TaxID=3365763 RepID=UPI003812751F
MDTVDGERVSRTPSKETCRVNQCPRTGGASHGVAVQLGGGSSPWQSPPDEGDLVLLAQIHGQSIDLNVYTQTLIVGTREDIAARRYEALEFEQQV